jgi:hypothetical protein
LLALLAVAMPLLPTYRAIFYQSPALLPGRYLMPALAAYAALISYGWVVVFKRWKAMPYALATAFAALALVVPFGVLLPAYAPPAIRFANATPALLTFENVAQVTDVSAQTVMLQDREGLRQYAHVKVTWRALRRSAVQLAFGISVLGRNAEVLGNMNVMPARGNYPATNWKVDATFTDDYYVLLEKPCPSLPALGRISIGVYEYEQTAGEGLGIRITRQLEPRDSDNRTVAPIVGQFRIEAPANPLPVFWQPPRAMFNAIALRDAAIPEVVRAGDTITVKLTYEAWASGLPDGIGFVHVLDASGMHIAQDDHIPQYGAYPTDMWAAGECIREEYSLQIPPTASGELKVQTGFYAVSDGTRFLTGTQDDLVPLGVIRVSP